MIPVAKRDGYAYRCHMHPLESPKLMTEITDGEFIRRQRKAGKLKLREVAAATGVSVSQLSRIETGHRTAKPDTVAKVVNAIGSLWADRQAAS